MLRIHFTAEDLGRVRLAPGPDPLWETRLSAELVRDAEAARTFGRWRSDVVRDLPRPALPYLHLVHAGSRVPDFLTPADGCTGFDAGADLVIATSRRHIASGVAGVGARSSIEGWVRGLAAGSPSALATLRAGMSAYHRHAVLPLWDRIRRCVEADRAARVQAMALQGSDEALATLHPAVTWSGPVLTVDDGGPARDLHLLGRGLRLVPTYFGTRAPLTFADPQLTPTLVFAVARDRHVADSTIDEDGALPALMGRTRAAALLAITTPVTTSGLARRMNTSIASASQHTAVLRRAGLIASRREGRCVVHALTTLGAGLLRVPDTERALSA